MTDTPAPQLPPPPRRPATPGELFRAFNRLALQGFGGVLPVAQRELVERLQWLSPAQFLELLSLAQVLPGPNVVNLALMIGDRFLGWRGAAAAVAGMLIAPLCLVLLLAALVAQAQDLPWLAGALRGMGVVSAGLVVSTALKLAGGLHRNAMGLPLCAVLVGSCALAVGWLRLPLALVVLGLGSLAVTWSAWSLQKCEHQGRGPSP